MSLEWLMPKKPTAPLPPPNTATQAQLNPVSTPTQAQSLVSTGSVSGLKRRATTKKRSLIGGY